DVSHSSFHSSPALSGSSSSSISSLMLLKPASSMAFLNNSRMTFRQKASNSAWVNLLVFWVGSSFSNASTSSSIKALVDFPSATWNSNGMDFKSFNMGQRGDGTDSVIWEAMITYYRFHGMNCSVSKSFEGLGFVVNPFQGFVFGLEEAFLAGFSLVHLSLLADLHSGLVHLFNGVHQLPKILAGE